VGEACPIAQASWYKHGGRHGRHKGQIVGYLQQVSNCYCKGNLAIYGNAIVPAAKHLFAPIARPSIFIKEHGGTCLVCATGRPAGAALESPLGTVKVLTAGAVRSCGFDERDIAAMTDYAEIGLLPEERLLEMPYCLNHLLGIVRFWNE
jgi:hypothetical protein